jgi:hypothetical protein
MRGPRVSLSVCRHDPLQSLARRLPLPILRRAPEVGEFPAGLLNFYNDGKTLPYRGANAFALFWEAAEQLEHTEI